MEHLDSGAYLELRDEAENDGIEEPNTVQMVSDFVLIASEFKYF